MNLVFIASVCTVFVFYWLARLGVVNKYTAGLLGVFLGGPLLGFTGYLIAGLGAVHIELQGQSSDFQYKYLQTEAPPEAGRSARYMREVMLTRIGCYALGFFISTRMPAAPFQIPWFITIPFLMLFATFAIERANAVELSVRVALVGLAVAGLNHFILYVTAGDFNPAVAVILGLSVASGLLPDVSTRYDESRPKDSQMRWSITKVWTAAIAFLLTWATPGLGVAVSNRALGDSRHQTQTFYGHQEAILEGWSAGAITIWGTMTGKTMLGELLQNWVLNIPSDLNDPARLATLGAASMLTTYLLWACFAQPLPKLSPAQSRALSVIGSVGILIQSIVLIGPLTLLYAVVGLVVAVCLEEPDLRPLILLFLAV